MELIEFLTQYVVLLVVGICLGVGYVIKHLIPSDGVNRFIPIIMALLGVAVNIWINLAFTPQILLGGLVSGLASTGLHQVFKQFIERKRGGADDEGE